MRIQISKFAFIGAEWKNLIAFEFDINLMVLKWSNVQNHLLFIYVLILEISQLVALKFLDTRFANYGNHILKNERRSTGIQMIRVKINWP